MNDLAILTHSRDGFHRRPYYVHDLMECWREQGLRVAVVNERDPHVPARLALLHSDISVIRPETRALAARYPRVLNGGVLDIRKRRYIEEVHRGDAVEGPVIVKTDGNFHGLPDLRWRTDAALWIATRLPWSLRPVLLKYEVFPSVAAVPRGVWRNRNLVVQRFLAEREGSAFCSRHWFVFGDRELHRRAIGDTFEVKAGIRIEALDEPVPTQLRAIRKTLGVDYAKFDYGLVDGELILYDVNPTPGTSPRTHRPSIEEMARGVEGFW